MKKIKLFSTMLLLLSLLGIASCNSNSSSDEPSETETPDTPLEPTEPEEPVIPEPVEPEEPEEPEIPEDPSYSFSTASATTKLNLSKNGYVLNGVTDFSNYENTAAYVKVTNPREFLMAIANAKNEYTNKWNEETSSVDQTLTKEGTVRVIEIVNDLDLGFNNLDSDLQSNSLVTNFIKTYEPTTRMVKENGISQIKIENISNLLIYSKNGAKITHAGFKLTSCDNIVIRNLSFDEIWEWEDSNTNTSSKIGDYDKFGWAYFKIAFCGQIWIDHCDFGKSYDGQIDYSNPVSNTKGTSFRLPYGSDGSNGLHISFCNFNAGSDDKDGYLYKMMMEIEEAYQQGSLDYLYYKALRDTGYTFDEILYGLAIPQKKGFLLGDDAKYGEDDFTYNLSLNVSFDSCYFKNIEDRLPKLRGGNAIMSNCIVDTFEYIDYRSILRTTRNGLTAASAVQKVNSSWKCALVSQGLLVGNQGSLLAQNCIFRGIDTLIKNNDTKNSAPYNYGGYDILNCSYQRTRTSSIVKGSKATNSTFRSSAQTLSLPFTYHTENGEAPYNVNAIDLKDLEDYIHDIKYGVGTKQNVTDWLKCEY